MSELRGLGAVNEELIQRGGRLFAVSVDGPEDSMRVVRRQELEYAILCDIEHSIIASYGLVHEGGGITGGDVAVPAQVLIDTTGQIAWKHVSQNVPDRVDPREVLEIVRGMSR